MIKVKDFMHYICNVLGYRSFTGYPHEGFIPLYNSMDSGFMHYTPTVRPDIAFSLAIGTVLGGVKSVVIADGISFLEEYSKINKLILAHRCSFLILLYNNTSDKIPIKTFNMDSSFEDVLKKADNYISKNKKPCAIVFNEGVLL